MAKSKYNGKKGKKEVNPCYLNNCHHNKDKKRKKHNKDNNSMRK